MPTQMPRNGVPSLRTRRSSASTMPGTARSAAAQAPYAPTPGKTIRSALATASASAVTIRSVQPAVRSAFSTECRLPAP
jgi:hypothetical protein